MDMDTIAMNIKEVPLTKSFANFIPGDDPRGEIMARAHYSDTAPTSGKRKRGRNTGGHPPKGYFIDEIVGGYVCDQFLSLIS